MHISNDRYFRERQRHDLALRMIRHEARTCTIKACTGLTDDRIRRLCKTYEIHASVAPMRRRRGKALFLPATRTFISNRPVSRVSFAPSVCCSRRLATKACP
jgi:hypothetical protein